MTEAALSVPDPARLASVQALCEYPNPYDYGSAEETLFVSAMGEIPRWHSERSGFFRALLAMKNFDPDCLETMDDCAAIPFVHANFFKTHEVLSVGRDEIALHLTSSGTTG